MGEKSSEKTMGNDIIPEDLSDFLTASEEDTIMLTGIFPEPAIIRKSYRVPLSNNDPVYAEINGQNYRLQNISHHGIGLLSDDPSLFQKDDMLSEIHLVIEGDVLKAEAVVRHVTPLETGFYLYGMELHYFSDTDQEKAKDWVTRLQKRVFNTQEP